ncbi:tetratricopeptide repeat protein [Leptospira venezuelensis]|uniref:tetratricopeptide repeat protein n=1 Tax=Leptospira venezuelensis TaxID=1958811 RepID=UPI000A37E39C|nr:tetratricopeptide repeat protein [Leptospira venezuelensis]
MKNIKLLFLIIPFLLFVSSLTSQDHRTDIRDLNKLKNIIEGDSKVHSLTLPKKDEAILFLGYLGSSADSVYLCNLLNKEEFRDHYISIIRALGFLRSDNSVLCLIQKLKKNENVVEKWHIYEGLIYNIKDSNREKNTISELEKALRETVGDTRENFRKLLIRITNDKSGKYIEGINFEEIGSIFVSKGMPTQKLLAKMFEFNLKQNQYESLLPDLELITKKNKDLWIGYLLRGYCYYQLKRYYEAEINFKNSIELNPQDSNSYFYLGNIYSLKGAKVVSKQYYENALKYTPSVINEIIINEKIHEIDNSLRK